MIAAIILAAGASHRMGYPKALLRYRGTTFLEAILQACNGAGIARQVVVLGPDSPKVLSENALHSGNIEVVENSDPATGPMRSLQLALNVVLNHSVDAVLVWHVDRPHVTVDTVTALLDRFRSGGAAIVVPTHAGQRGHPVVFGRTVFEELLAVPDGEGARSVVRAAPQRVATVPVDDAAVVEDVDTPADYRNLLRRSDESRASPPRDLGR